MESPGIPKDEDDRIHLLRSYDILDSLPETSYDDIAHIASHVMGTPIVLVSLVDTDRQWFKARVGLDATETSREISFCGHVVYEQDTLVVPDARADHRFADNPLVAGRPDIRFYAGAPLYADGHVLGTLCAIDREPRTVAPEQVGILEALARQVMQLLELRRRAAEAERISADLRNVSLVQQRFFDLSTDMLCVAGYDGRFKRLNPAWAKVLGYSLDELEGKPFLDFVHPDDHEATVAEAAKLAEGEGNTIAFENRYRTRDGDYRWFMWSGTPDPENELLMAVARDMTPFKKAEQQLREAHERAEEANRAKSDFLANMSHELRTPLNSVIGFTNILLKNKNNALGSRELGYLRRIVTNGKHLLRLINDVLDLSKIEARRIELSCEPVDLGSLAQGVVDALEGQALAKQVQVGTTIPEGVKPLAADRHRLEQVLINLLGNALKFAEGGKVELRVRADDQGRPVRIDVIDDGVGVPADKQARIFESFRQADESTRRRFGGTGLGLTISRSLCEAQGFDLQLVSEEGRGSLFALSVANNDLPLVYEPPRVDVREDTIAPDEPVAEPRSGSKCHKLVLIIDDDADARAVLEDNLQSYGCQIVAANSGERGMQLARELRPDLITLDLMMPYMDGWAVLKALSDDPALRSIPVVVCSIVGGESRTTLAGAVAVMDKPVERNELYAVLERHLTDSQRHSVLVVEPEPIRRIRFDQWIRAAGAAPCIVENIEDAIGELDGHIPALVIVPMHMGAEMLSELRSRPRTLETPLLLHRAGASVLTEAPPSTRVLARDLLESDIVELLGDLLHAD